MEVILSRVRTKKLLFGSQRMNSSLGPQSPRGGSMKRMCNSDQTFGSESCNLDYGSIKLKWLTFGFIVMFLVPKPRADRE